MKMISELRHLDGIKSGSGVFAVNEGEYISTSIQQQQHQLHEEEGEATKKPSPQIIYSNVYAIVQQHQYLFDTLWEKATSAEQKIREIEEGIEQEFYELITDNKKASQVLLDLAKSVKKEALFFLPNDRALVRLSRLGIIDHVMKAADNGAIIKIICPLTQSNSHIIKKNENGSDIRILDGNNLASSYMFIVDGAKFLLAEISESPSSSTRPNADDSGTFEEAIGDFTIYSNSRLSVESFRSVFELLWKERLLNEELNKADRMQRDFINITAHELRTPLQPILGISEIFCTETNKEKKEEEWEAKNGGEYKQQEGKSMEVIYRNAKRMYKLIEDILDISKIEGQLLHLNKEIIDLNEILFMVVDNYNYKKSNNEKKTDYDNYPVEIIISFESKEDYHRSYDGSRNMEEEDKKEEVIFVEADRNRLCQVLDNILNNALKFTKKGSITVSVKADNKEATVSIKDTGTGIDPQVMPTLFTKFGTSTSCGSGGIGLGLFISKGIIEAHGGRIWAENNKNGKGGATVSFNLPRTIL